MRRAAMRFVDLSHALEDAMAAYPGLPTPRIGALLDHAASRSRYEGQAEFYINRFEMMGNVGTYLDSPFHRYSDAPDLAALPLAALAGLPGVVADATQHKDRGLVLDLPEEQLRGRAVLVRTDWDQRWEQVRYWAPGPFLAKASVERLARAEAALVGVDFWNVDDFADPARPAHTLLLKQGILVVEHLANLRALPREGFRFFAVPPRIVKGASFPVRAFAEVP